jgi:hypothetical protein
LSGINSSKRDWRLGIGDWSIEKVVFLYITATLSEADIQDIKAALVTIQQKLPFLITLKISFIAAHK